MYKDQKAVWITWERQQRNRSMARELEAELYEIVHGTGRLRRYARCMLDTLKVVRRDRPAVIFFQNPSVVLGLWLVILARMGLTRGAALVGDFHNAGVQGTPGITLLNKVIAVSCSYVIVSNDNLSKKVRAWGATPFSFPDPLPDLGADILPSVGSSSPFRVLFVCSWAADEPVEEVMRAAELLPDPEFWQIRITGRPKPERSQTSLPVNITLTGFLPEAEFHAALLNAHVVMDLTTRDDCMVCGAYEGLAAGKPLVLSANAPTEEWFGDAASYCDNSAESIARALLDVRTGYAEYVGLAVERRDVLGRKTRALTSNLKRCLAASAVSGA